eukprot:3965519-Prymnesium_polylepis.2
MRLAGNRGRKSFTRYGCFDLVSASRMYLANKICTNVCATALKAAKQGMSATSGFGAPGRLHYSFTNAKRKSGAKPPHILRARFIR